MNPGSIIAWLKGLSVGAKVALAVTSLVVVGAIAQAAQPAHVPPPTTTPTVQQSEQPQQPVLTTKRVITTVPIPFKKRTIEDPSLRRGERRLTTAGVPGSKSITYEVSLEDGTEVARRKVSESIARRPVDEVTIVGTYVYVAPKPKPQPIANSCDPNYADACVPIASDVDCAGGSGNGPAYVQGPVRVVGSDIYGLDRDGDGWGCE